VYAELEFVRPNGAARKTLVFVDLGSPSMVLSEELFKELHIGPDRSLIFRIGEMAVPVDSRTVTSDPSWFPFSIGKNRKVEGLLPAGIMQKYQVRFDYACHTVTLAQPVTLHPEGTPAPFRGNKKTGLIAIEVMINDKSYPITIDNGSGYTWIRKSTAREWLSGHPEWKRGTGAVGPSNMRMADDGIETAGEILRIPEIKVGSLRIQNAGALAIGQDNSGRDFMDWYSSKNAGPVIGWLGGNVLRAFRITIDYPERVVYWLTQTALDSHDLDYIGLTSIFKNGGYFVGAIAMQNGKPTVTGVHVGDKLIQIGPVRTNGASAEAILGAMHGKSGTRRSLILERNGKQIQLEAIVTAF